MQCPQCGSYNVQKFSMAYKTGTTEKLVEEQYRHLNVNNQTRQTLLAKDLAPPEKIKVKKPNPISLVFEKVFFVFAMLIFMMVFSTPLGCFFSFIICGIVIYLGFKYGINKKYYKNLEKWQKNEDLYNQQIAEWDNYWICLKCGSKFTELIP